MLTDMEHKTLKMSIGEPAILNENEDMPSINLTATSGGYIEGQIFYNGREVKEITDKEISAGNELIIDINDLLLDSDILSEPGKYQVEIKMENKEKKVIYDSFYFTIMDKDNIPANSSKIACLDENDKMVYVPDYKGNRIPDFSNAGYMGGGIEIPDVPVKVELEPEEGDDRERIQAAINKVAKIPYDENGFRGAILLKEGIYEVKGTLRINTGGIVLRGEGPGEYKKQAPDPPDSVTDIKNELKDKNGTILLATKEISGTFPADISLIEVEGSGSITETSSPRAIIDNYVPVGAIEFHVEDISGFNVGDSIIVRRYGNSDWISEIGMDSIPSPEGRNTNQWSPFSIDYERIITEIEGNKVTIDAPILNAIEKRWGGGEVIKYSCNRISQVGVEGLRAISVWEATEEGKDPLNHMDNFIILDGAKNAWVRDVVFDHFVSRGLYVGRGGKWVTVEDVSALLADDKYYQNLGYVGRSNLGLAGSFNLVQRAFTTNQRHAFHVTSRVPGPNVFLNCQNVGRPGVSEPHHRWSTGGLFDNVNDAINLMNRLWLGSGHGWAGANYVAWNTLGGSLVNEQPPTTQNWAIGHVGEKSDGSFHDWNMDIFGKSTGYWESHNQHVEPQSLYLQQLQERLGKEALRNIGY